jgi:formylglycine-generating enzyme required for sulfatase activity
MTTTINIVRQPKKVKGFTEIINGVPLDMILIPPGSFMMGASEQEELSNSTERPVHLVKVSQFFMGRYPITQAQWRAVASLPQEGRELKDDPSRFQGDKKPVESVSWYDAIEFCARLSRYTNKNYRLPSEAEWEYACRAGTKTPFHFGETISTKLANYNGTDEKYGIYGKGEKGEYRQTTTDVDYFDAANEFGLSDLHGNVWEWCADPWHDNYDGALGHGKVWDEQADNDNRYQNILENLDTLFKDSRLRVRRGGSWFNYANSLPFRLSPQLYPRLGQLLWFSCCEGLVQDSFPFALLLFFPLPSLPHKCRFLTFGWRQDKGD